MGKKHASQYANFGWLQKAGIFLHSFTPLFLSKGYEEL